MGGGIWFIVMLFFFLIFGLDQLLFMAVYFILIGVFYWWRSKKVNPVPKWELGLAIVCSGILTLSIFMGFLEYKQYSKREENRKRLELYRKMATETKTNDEIYNSTITPSNEAYQSSSTTIYEEEEYYEDDSEILDFDAGYEDGYQDGRWRSPGFSKRSYDYDYEEGYAQGYYEAAHDEPDYKEGEEYDW